AATAEISRSQVWQWIRHGTRLDDGTTVTRELVRSVLRREHEALVLEAGPDGERIERIGQAVGLFTETALGEDYPAFLTIPAYARRVDRHLAVPVLRAGRSGPSPGRGGPAVSG